MECSKVLTTDMNHSKIVQFTARFKIRSRQCVLGKVNFRSKIQSSSRLWITWLPGNIHSVF